MRSMRLSAYRLAADRSMCIGEAGLDIGRLEKRELCQDFLRGITRRQLDTCLRLILASLTFAVPLALASASL